MPKNPVEEFRQYQSAQTDTRKQKEHVLWDAWKQAPAHEKPKHLEPLLQIYAPTFQKKVNEWSRGARAIQPSAFKAELHKQFINALETYNPTKAALSTHVETRLKKAQRFVTKHQNLAYIPEGQVAHIGRIMRAQSELGEQFGRDPTHDEIADHLGMTPKRVGTILHSMKKDIPASMLVTDQVTNISPREREVLDLLQFNLSQDEKQVFDLLYGRNGQPSIQSTNDIAKKLGKSAPQVSRLKTSIINKYKNYA